MLYPIAPQSPQLPSAHTGDLADATSRFGLEVELAAEVLDQLRAVTAIRTDIEAVGDGGRDWWSPAALWAGDGVVPARAGAVASPTSVDEVSAVLRICHAAGVPVTPVAGRSGVLGGSITLYGGVALDLCQMSGIVSVDRESQLVEVLAGTWGDKFESAMQSEFDLTVGHWPQSIALSTVGGWVACRGAGQMSTRYGKIEDMVSGLEVVLADGTIIRTGDQPRQAVGPDFSQLFIGSEGTLGVITSVSLRAHRRPIAQRQAAYGFTSFGDALSAMREIVQRGATPAVLRLYDHWESMQQLGCDGQTHALLVLDEGEQGLIDWTMSVVEQCCAAGRPLDESLVDSWMGHRNRIPDLQKLGSQGYVWDTMEVTGSWAELDEMYTKTVAAMSAVEHALVVSAHQSHSYLDGGCIYFTFAGKPPTELREEFYRSMWDVGARTVLEAGGSLSHHHGIGLHRGYLMDAALGSTMGVFRSIKAALDPSGILNPGKMGLDSPFGPRAWTR